MGGAIDETLAANRAAARGSSAPARPSRGLVVVTCMDARIDTGRVFGLGDGEAHVLRNAGGRVTDDVLRSLTASWHLLGTRAVMVVHHTDCGMHAPDPEALRRELEAAAGSSVAGLDLLSFSDEEASVRDDVARVREWPLTPADAEVRGFIYDVRSGLLREVQ